MKYHPPTRRMLPNKAQPKLPSNQIAITISPPLRLVGKGHIYKTKSDLYKADKQHIQWCLTDCSKEYFIYPELDKNGRLHYHGIITLHNKVLWHRCSIEEIRALGFIEVKTDIDAGWIKYCQKEWDHTKEVLQIESPIEYQPIRRKLRIQQKEQPLTPASETVNKQLTLSEAFKQASLNNNPQVTIIINP